MSQEIKFCHECENDYLEDPCPICPLAERLRLAAEGVERVQKFHLVEGTYPHDLTSRMNAVAAAGTYGRLVLAGVTTTAPVKSYPPLPLQYAIFEWTDGPYDQNEHRTRLYQWNTLRDDLTALIAQLRIQVSDLRAAARKES